MRNLRLLHPFLFAALPILNVLTENPGGATLADVVWLAGLIVAGCLAGYAVVALANRGRWADPVVPLVVLAGVLWFYGYEAIRWVYRWARGTPAPVVVTALVVAGAAALTIVGLRALARRPRALDRTTAFLGLTGLLLVTWSGVRIGSDQLRARSDVRGSRLGGVLAQPVGGPGSLAAAGPRRDIYLIILDEYANSKVLRERFGFDNSGFEDSLRQLGFTVPSLVRSNYVHTLLSLPSLLNFSHLTQIADEVGQRETDPTLANYLMENNRTAAFLKARGYRFLFFPSQWWISTQHNRNADWEFEPWSGFSLQRDLTRSDMRRVFAGRTLLRLLGRDFSYDADHVTRTLAALAKVPEIPEPTFALAHLLNPHYPYVFASDCRVLPARPMGGWDQRRREAYLDQLRCLNHLLLGVVTTLQRSSPSPVILLVGDHGTSTLEYSDAESAEAVTPAQARERLGAFGAFFLPAGGDRLFPESVTLVNVIPRVLNFYFGAGIKLAPDSLYMSLEKTPYLFAPVDPVTLSGG